MHGERFTGNARIVTRKGGGGGAARGSPRPVFALTIGQICPIWMAADGREFLKRLRRLGKMLGDLELTKDDLP